MTERPARLRPTEEAIKFGIATVTVASLLAGCAMMGSGGGPSAKAALQPTKGNSAAGTATFTQSGDKVRVVANITGLKPNQEHGFHIHEKGDCSSGDGMSAGGHFNPLGKPHAHPSTPERHAGDMPALKADANGNATLSTELDVITVTEGPTSIIGRGLIVHAQPDDFKTQPTGNAGARIACGVIQKS
ncbi:MAG TPA: superoxide dismutase family protein [Burkholderiales bacterium]|nr:superoxide dismutase family protein [Burkholderiales bacterium]